MNSLYKNIIIPFDFSNCAKNALREGNRLAQNNDGHITVFFVVSVTSLTTDVSEVKVNAENQIEEILKTENIENYTVKIGHGVPEEEIAKICNSGDFTFCLMGTHSRHEIISDLIGTLVPQVMEVCKIPLLILPDGKHLNEINKIAFAADFKKIDDLSVLDGLNNFCQSFDAELHLVYINEAPEEVSTDEIEEANQLHQAFWDINHAFFLSKDKDPVKGITAYVTSNKIDVLAILPRKHNFIERLFKGSVSKQIALQLKIPLLCIHG